MTQQQDLPLEKLKALIPRLASTHDGEVVATARAIERILARFGCDWHDLVSVIGPTAAQPAPPPRPDFEDNADWRPMAAFCADRAVRLTDKEQKFVFDLLAHWRGGLTIKQAAWLERIAMRLASSAA